MSSTLLRVRVPPRVQSERQKIRRYYHKQIKNPVRKLFKKRPGGGIGRRTGLRSQWAYARVGSSPAPGTLLSHLFGEFFISSNILIPHKPFVHK